MFNVFEKFYQQLVINNRLFTRQFFLHKSILATCPLRKSLLWLCSKFHSRTHADWFRFFSCKVNSFVFSEFRQQNYTQLLWSRFRTHLIGTSKKLYVRHFVLTELESEKLHFCWELQHVQLQHALLHVCIMKYSSYSCLSNKIRGI